MEQSQEIGELVKAMAKAQARMEAAAKDSKNPFFKSKYADYSSVRGASFPSLNENGIAVFQTTTPGENGQINIITTLAHESGQWIRSVLPIKPVKSDPQGIGSAITYGRRYGLAAITGIAQEDDDAESAMNRNGNHRNGTSNKKPSQRQPSATPQNRSSQQDTMTQSQQAEIKMLKNIVCGHVGCSGKEFYDEYKIRQGITEKQSEAIIEKLKADIELFKKDPKINKQETSNG